VGVFGGGVFLFLAALVPESFFVFGFGCDQGGLFGLFLLLYADML